MIKRTDHKFKAEDPNIKKQQEAQKLVEKDKKAQLKEIRDANQAHSELVAQARKKYKDAEQEQKVRNEAAKERAKLLLELEQRPKEKVTVDSLQELLNEANKLLGIKEKQVIEGEKRTWRQFANAWGETLGVVDKKVQLSEDLQVKLEALNRAREEGRKLITKTPEAKEAHEIEVFKYTYLIEKIRKTGIEREKLVSGKEAISYAQDSTKLPDKLKHRLEGNSRELSADSIQLKQDKAEIRRKKFLADRGGNIESNQKHQRDLDNKLKTEKEKLGAIEARGKLKDSRVVAMMKDHSMYDSFIRNLEATEMKLFGEINPDPEKYKREARSNIQQLLKPGSIATRDALEVQESVKLSERKGLEFFDLSVKMPSRVISSVADDKYVSAQTSSKEDTQPQRLSVISSAALEGSLNESAVSIQKRRDSIANDDELEFFDVLEAPLERKFSTVVPREEDIQPKGRSVASLAELMGEERKSGLFEGNLDLSNRVRDSDAAQRRILSEPTKSFVQVLEQSRGVSKEESEALARITKIELKGKDLFQSCIEGFENIKDTEGKEAYKQHLKERFIKTIKDSVMATGRDEAFEFIPNKLKLEAKAEIKGRETDTRWLVDDLDDIKEKEDKQEKYIDKYEKSYSQDLERIIDKAVNKLEEEVKSGSNSVQAKIDKQSRYWFNFPGKIYDGFSDMFHKAALVVGATKPNAAEIFEEAAKYSQNLKVALEKDYEKRKNQRKGKGSLSELTSHARGVSHEIVGNKVAEHNIHQGMFKNPLSNEAVVAFLRLNGTHEFNQLLDNAQKDKDNKSGAVDKFEEQLSKMKIKEKDFALFLEQREKLKGVRRTSEGLGDIEMQTLKASGVSHKSR